MNHEAKAALAAEVASLIEAKAEDVDDHVVVLSMALQLLCGRLYRVTLNQ